MAFNILRPLKMKSRGRTESRRVFVVVILAMYLAPESYKLRMHPGSELLVNPNPMEDGWVQHSANHGGYFALEFTFNLLNHKAYRYIAVIRWDSENFNLTGVKVYAQGMVRSDYVMLNTLSKDEVYLSSCRDLSPLEVTELRLMYLKRGLCLLEYRIALDAM